MGQNQGKGNGMVTAATRSGVVLETDRRAGACLPADEQALVPGDAVTAVAAGVCLAAVALIGAGALAAACLRGCAAGPAAESAALYEANWRNGIYGDEMCGFEKEEAR